VIELCEPWLAVVVHHHNGFDHLGFSTEEKEKERRQKKKERRKRKSKRKNSSLVSLDSNTDSNCLLQTSNSLSKRIHSSKGLESSQMDLLQSQKEPIDSLLFDCEKKNQNAYRFMAG